MQNKIVSKGRRNGALSMLKLIAAIAIVFAHVPFPGRVGKILDVPTRFTVPFFCAVSGYYGFRADVSKLQRQLKKIVNLTILASGITFAWEVIYRVVIRHKGLQEYLSDLLNVKVLANFIYMGENPFGGHLWYLSAMIILYIILILYSRFWDAADRIDYTPLHCVAACGYFLQIALSIKFKGAGMKTQYMVYRYCLMNVLPAYCLGMFLREHRSRIVKNYGFTRAKAVGMIVLGVGLTGVQQFGIGTMSFPIGMIPVVVAIMLWATDESDLKPQSSSKRAFFICAETCATVVYVIHVLVNKIVLRTSKMVPLFAQIQSHAYIYPIFIMLVSVLIGAVVSIALYAIHSNKAARSARS